MSEHNVWMLCGDRTLSTFASHSIGPMGEHAEVMKKEKKVGGCLHGSMAPSTHLFAVLVVVHALLLVALLNSLAKQLRDRGREGKRASEETRNRDRCTTTVPEKIKSLGFLFVWAHTLHPSPAPLKHNTMCVRV